MSRKTCGIFEQKFKSFVKYFNDQITGDETLDITLRYFWIMGIFKATKFQKFRYLIFFFVSNIILQAVNIFKFTRVIIDQLDHPNKVLPVLETIYIFRFFSITLEGIVFYIHIGQIEKLIGNMVKFMKIYEVKTKEASFSGTKIQYTVIWIYRICVILLTISRTFRMILSKNLIILIFEEIPRSFPCFVTQIIYIFNTIYVVISFGFVVSLEGMFCVFLIHLEKAIFLMRKKVEALTNDINPVSNEQKLNKFLHMHCETLEMIGDFENSFGPYFVIWLFISFINTSLTLLNFKYLVSYTE